jgi:hypothetical protein
MKRLRQAMFFIFSAPQRGLVKMIFEFVEAFLNPILDFLFFVKNFKRKPHGEVFLQSKSLEP